MVRFGAIADYDAGTNIPGKPKEHLNYAGGIPAYIKEIGKERDNGYPGFDLK